uniref:hypothetical protein n=1 Tax=Nocardia farcinica TaxID=37329 RepID=UPI002456A2F2
LLGLIVLFLPGVVVAVRARIFGVGFALPRQWEVPRACHWPPPTPGGGFLCLSSSPPPPRVSPSPAPVSAWE